MTTRSHPGRAEAVLEDPRWGSLVHRDRRADGTFFYSVQSTGVYCRPSCGARTPRPENVQFFSTAREAEAQGFRACKRCRPDAQSPAAELAARIAGVCRLIERSATAPTLETLARAAGMSRFHLHRTFKSMTGVTPAEYASARRAARLRSSLATSRTVTEAIYEAGFNSSSRLYEGADRLLGMTPGELRAGGANREIHFAIGACSLGSILAARTERGVCAILMGDDPAELVRDLRGRFPNARLTGDNPAYRELVVRVAALVENPGSAFDLPLDIQGTAFQRRVWKALGQIRPGTTATYTEIAARIGAPAAARAVARACAANPLAVAIPCHRVVRHDGSLSGYRWGVERKRALLDRERES